MLGLHLTHICNEQSCPEHGHINFEVNQITQKSDRTQILGGNSDGKNDCKACPRNMLKTGILL